MKSIEQTINYLEKKYLDYQLRIDELIIEESSCLDPLVAESIRDFKVNLERKKRVLSSIINYIRSDI